MRSISFRVLSAAAMITALCLTVVCGRSQSNVEIVENYRTAMNSHDVSELMEIYSDDIRFEIPSMNMMLFGKEALRGIAEYDSALNTVMTISNIRTSGDSVLCEITETNNWMNAAGFSSAHYPQAVFIVKENRIAYIGAVISDSSAIHKDVLDSFIPFGNRNYPEIMAEMMPVGEFIFNGKNGATMVRLLREWRGAMESESAD
jgi:hypothetical protein